MRISFDPDGQEPRSHPGHIFDLQQKFTLFANRNDDRGLRNDAAPWVRHELAI